MADILIKDIPAISWIDYPKYIESASEIADKIRSMRVNDTTVAEVKKQLADARKITKALDERRIAIKKEYLKPYEDFAAKVDYLKKIIDEADSDLRSEVRALEEKERAEKKEELLTLWNLRKWAYGIDYYIPNAFDLWLQPCYLNKTMTLNKCEKEMIYFLEETQRDLDCISKLPDKEEIFMEYSASLNLSEAISKVKQRKDYIETIKQDQPEESSCMFIVYGEKDIAFTENLLKNNKINFKKG